MVPLWMVPLWMRLPALNVSWVLSSLQISSGILTLNRLSKILEICWANSIDPLSIWLHLLCFIFARVKLAFRYSIAFSMAINHSLYSSVQTFTSSKHHLISTYSNHFHLKRMTQSAFYRELPRFGRQSHVILTLSTSVLIASSQKSIFIFPFYSRYLYFLSSIRITLHIQKYFYYNIPPWVALYPVLVFILFSFNDDPQVF